MGKGANESGDYEAVHDYNSYCVLIQEAIGIALNDFTCEDYCKNGATCQQFGDLPVCTCAEGYIGTFCQIPLENAENILTDGLDKLIQEKEYSLITTKVLESIISSQNLKKILN